MSVDIKQHTVKLGNKDYVQVSGRVLMAHDGNPEQLSIVTEVVYEDEEKIRVRAAISTRKGTFTGHAESYKSTGSPQEKKTPLEVAETSAIGRALGFAGYAIEGGIASADEVSNAVSRDDAPVQKRKPTPISVGVYVGDEASPASMLARLDAAMKACHMSRGELVTQWGTLGFNGRTREQLSPAQMDKAIAHFEEIAAGLAPVESLPF